MRLMRAIALLNALVLMNDPALAALPSSSLSTEIDKSWVNGNPDVSAQSNIGPVAVSDQGALYDQNAKLIDWSAASSHGELTTSSSVSLITGGQQGLYLTSTSYGRSFFTVSDSADDRFITAHMDLDFTLLGNGPFSRESVILSLGKFVINSYNTTYYIPQSGPYGSPYYLPSQSCLNYSYCYSGTWTIDVTFDSQTNYMLDLNSFSGLDSSTTTYDSYGQPVTTYATIQSASSSGALRLYGDDPTTVFSFGDGTIISSDVPETATWITMLMGLCAIGVAMRRRQRVIGLRS